MKGKFYVYMHKYASGDMSGDPFYIGKGSGRRAKVQSGRGKWWQRIVKKYGYEIEIVQDGMSEDDAFLLEMWLIAKLKHEGIIITNATIGGDGVSYGDDYINPLGKIVYCSNGMVFKSTKDAASWVVNNVRSTASSSMIASCCTGRKRTSYGLAWSYEGTPEEPIDFRAKYMSKLSKKVFCSNGKSFTSCAEAATWLKSIGHKNATGVNVGSCASGKVKTAHGFAWSHDAVPEMGKTHREMVAASKSKKVVCSNGMVFNSIKDASNWAKNEGLGTSGKSVIGRCANGYQETAYGLRWSFA